MSMRENIKNAAKSLRDTDIDAMFSYWNTLQEQGDADVLAPTEANKDTDFLDEHEHLYKKLTGHASTCIRSHLEAQLLRCMKGENIERGLYLILELLALAFRVDKHFRRNIADFNANYVFTDKAKDFYVRVLFKDGKMHLTRKEMENPTFALIFKDTTSVFKLITSKEPDILQAMLNQDIAFTGNINYMNKFGYMAQHLLLRITGGASFAD